MLPFSLYQISTKKHNCHPYWVFLCQNHATVWRPAFLDCANSMLGGHTVLMMSVVILVNE